MSAQIGMNAKENMGGGIKTALLILQSLNVMHLLSKSKALGENFRLELSGCFRFSASVLRWKRDTLLFVNQKVYLVNEYVYRICKSIDLQINICKRKRLQNFRQRFLEDSKAILRLRMASPFSSCVSKRAVT